jgi:DNA-binding CsgD family transcriptional regulator
MATGYQDLTEKEKQTLRLIVRGHDAKSSARDLGLSVHTVNERLRDARRKMGVSSSREAARLLLAAEDGHPQSFGDKTIGEAAGPGTVAPDAVPEMVQARSRGWSGIIAGGAVMSITVGMLAWSLVAAGGVETAQGSGTGETSAAVTETDVVRTARNWLVLSDQGRWREGWQGTGSQFQRANTVEAWAKAATQVRVPLGAVIARTALSEETVPAPPRGVQVVKFRTSFANKANVIETVSLAREGSAWKIVGIMVD